MREIILDTETTGLYPNQGHRVIEIGAIEAINGKLTGHKFQTYLKPDIDVDKRAEAVNGLNREMLANEPVFEDVLHNFVRFMKPNEKEYIRLVAHNAPFDVNFIENEFKRSGNKDSYILLMDNVEIIDTKKMAEHLGKKHTSLDALSKEYEIDISHRQIHGAIKDCELLWKVYQELRKESAGDSECL